MPLYSLIPHFTIFSHNNNKFLQRSEVQGAIYGGSQKIRFPILLPPNNFT
jgi:hypothetical protein